MQLEAEAEFLEELAAERIYLYVPYPERERARSLGARWDPQVCLWYATPRMKLARFARWRPIWPLEDDPTVTVLGIDSQCWKCRAHTLTVAACQYDDQFTFAHRGVLQVLASQLTVERMSELGAGPLRPRYSKVTKQSNWSNGCVECDALLAAGPILANLRSFVAQGQAELPVVTRARVPVEMLSSWREFG